MTEALTPDFIPVMVPLAAAVFVESDSATDGDGTPYTAPIAILELNEYPSAELLFRDLVDLPNSAECRVAADTWFGLPELGRSEYEQQHAEHPMVRFALMPSEGLGSAPVERLTFLVCAQCEALFFAELTSREELAIGPTIPDHVSPDDPVLGIPDMITAVYDLADIAEAELWAWRNAYGDYAPHDLTSDTLTSGDGNV